ncbi:prostamide/prostaglandin F synthase-like [Branchiostoma floridae]|uniref:Prostamide/prostaglandin F synthase n=1 Tax=Branchiostoma floridae TaxID=7739 RepID=A0A9J7NA42_BRAFL|nr:prostamide/prostaglandin F synthase-like [Branchiostoma floridae]
MSGERVKKIAVNLVKDVKTGQTVPLGSLWESRACVLLFLRRFGCQVCRWTASELSKLKPQLDAANVSLVGVGPEEVGVEEFVQGKFFAGDLYVDETKQCYKDLGYRRYNALNVIPAAASKKSRDVINKAKAEGIPGNFKGDLLQAGGTLIVGAGGEKVLLNFVQDSPGDHVELQEVLRLLGLEGAVQASAQPKCDDTMCTM